MNKDIIKQFLTEIVQDVPHDKRVLERFKHRFAKKNSCDIIQNTEIIEAYRNMIKLGELSPNKELEEVLLTKNVRTLSGVAVIAVLTKPYPCPGNCLFCPTAKNMPKSYLANEPAVMRAVLTKFDPYEQTFVRTKSLQANGHSTDKIELIVMGGTFSFFPPRYQKWFIKECFRAANDFPFKRKPKTSSTLEKEKKRNEKSRNRIIGLTLETRPDYIDEKEIIKFRYLGATRVEIGVQSIFDDILKKNNRMHLTDATICATKLLKNAGFKITYHLMPGLYGSTPEKDIQLFKTIYSDPRFQPDMVKIYPCVVNEDAALYHLWGKKEYKPLTNAQTKRIARKIKGITPPYVRINRLIRDIPEESIAAGPTITNLRQILQQEGVVCNCIRCREIKGTYTIKDTIILDRIDYDAANGKEIFLQFVSENKQKLYAILRLRIPKDTESQNHYIKALRGCALVREIHTYGKAVKIEDKKNTHEVQHSGLGKRLLQEAERIARDECGHEKIAVISGVGVRDYYRKNGYRLIDEYMVKNLMKNKQS
ncbi:MAG: tRNA uridine(34) 5-carboxymethylaminomethyl modification radical SAM/GNAT enzyme Elp3 [bacterium]